MSFGKMAPSLETGGSGKSIIKVWTKQTTIGQSRQVLSVDDGDDDDDDDDNDGDVTRETHRKEKMPKKERARCFFLSMRYRR